MHACVCLGGHKEKTNGRSILNEVELGGRAYVLLQLL